MAFNVNRVDINLQCNFEEITGITENNTSVKCLEDYSIVSRKHLEKIINNSERCLTEDEHRWLIRRDCKKVISAIKKYTRLENVLRDGDDSKEEKCNEIPIYNQYVLNNGCFYFKNIMFVNRVLNVNSEISAVDNSETNFNVIVENNLTVINIKQLNIKINNNNSNHDIFDYDYNVRNVENNNSRVFVVDLERIYWNKWRDYIKKKIMTRSNKFDKINSFLLKIQEKLNSDQSKTVKCRKVSNHVISKPLKTAYNYQQAKIDNQKKLLDKQQKEIERLKLQQLKLESEKAMLENQKLLDQTYDKSEKMVKIKNVARNISAVKASPSDILNRMEIRALDRQAKWNAIKERHRKMEADKQRKKEELKEKCLKEQMEQKRKQLFEARENLRLKKIEESKKKIEREIWQENIKIADDFYRKVLLRKGLHAFTLNLESTRSQMHKAANYYNGKILGVCFNKWLFFTNNNLNEKMFLAEQFYNRKLKKSAFIGFLKILEDTKKKEQVAEDWNNFKIQEFWFNQWYNYVIEINLETHKKMLEAESYHNRLIIKRCFDNWRKFPEIIYKERIKDCRLRMWHEKVQEIIPDFIPPEI